MFVGLENAANFTTHKVCLSPASRFIHHLQIAKCWEIAKKNILWTYSRQPLNISLYSILLLSVSKKQLLVFLIFYLFLAWPLKYLVLVHFKFITSVISNMIDLYINWTNTVKDHHKTLACAIYPWANICRWSHLWMS